MKWKVKNFYKITPAKIRKIADSVYIGCTAGLGTSIINNYKLLGLITLIAMISAKIASNGYTED